MRFPANAEESFTAHSYPSTTEEFVAEHGDVEMELPNGVVTLGEVFETLPNEEFQTEEDVRYAAYGALGEEAIGRKGYSDRDATCPGERGYQQVSF